VTIRKIKIWLYKLLAPILPTIWRLIHSSPIFIAPLHNNKITIEKYFVRDSGICFGYHDKTPFSQDNKKLLAMNITHNQTNANSECKEIEIGYFEINKSFPNDNFIKLSTTDTWCWQQGCMLQWDPRDPNNRIIYNALVNKKYGAKIFDIKMQRIIKTLPEPLYSISPDMEHGISLNFSRLGRLRPGYGYGLIKDKSIDDPAPKDEGLKLINLNTNQTSLLLSLSELSKQVQAQPNAEHYINHASFSPSGDRVVFFHIWKLPKSNKREIRFCFYDIDTSNFGVIEDKRTPSHYCWKDKDTILATNIDHNRIWNYTLYNIIQNTKLDLDIGLIQDGHPMFSPVDNDIFITDTYPDKRGDQHLCLVNLKKKTTHELISFYSPYEFRGQVRCDLHPRWDRQGKKICVDNTVLGNRLMSVVKI